MQLLAPLRKEKLKKQGKDKSRTVAQLPAPSQALLFAKTHNHPNRQPKMPSLPEALNSKRNKGASFSAKKAQSTGITAGKSKKGSPRRASSRKSGQKGKLVQQLKEGSGQLTGVGYSVSKSYFPLTHEGKEIQAYKSYLIGENGDHIQHDQEQFNNSIESSSELPPDSGFVAQIPLSYQQHYQESRGLNLSQGVSRQDWEAFETLRMKNQQLNNYVEELEQVEQRMQDEHERQQKAAGTRFEEERGKLRSQVEQLRQEQARLNHANATLQQLCNQGKQSLDLMTMRYNEMLQAGEKGGQGAVKEGVGRGKGEETALRRVQQLERELQSSYRHNDDKDRQRKDYQLRLSLCQSEKADIKVKAEQMLSMLRLVQKSADL